MGYQKVRAEQFYVILVSCKEKHVSLCFDLLNPLNHFLSEVFSLCIRKIRRIQVHFEMIMRIRNFITRSIIHYLSLLALTIQ